jgi:dihydropyrimidine dehydrogenase (NAD+) subunit PreA
MAESGLGSDVGQNPELVAAFTRATRKGTNLPILAKMTPNIGTWSCRALAAIEAGATGIAAINTFKSVMNVDLDTFSSGPDVVEKTSVGGYSGKAVKADRAALHPSMKSFEGIRDVPVSGMGGIETWRDAAEFNGPGLRNIQVTTAVIAVRLPHHRRFERGMKLYLGAHGYTSVSEIVGKALPRSGPRGATTGRASVSRSS